MKNNIMLAIVEHSEFSLREAQQDDQLFLENLFRSTRDFLLQLNLPVQHLDMLIKQQYNMQQAAYQQQFPDSITWIISESDKAVGKMTIAQTAEGLHIVDIIFATDVRNKGYGSSLLKTLQLLASKNSISLSLAVDNQNTRAKKLYLSVGFSVEKTSDTHDFLRWYPSDK